MKKRWDVPPKKRFYLPVTSYYDYGWNAPDPSTEPNYGRVIEGKFLWRKNGVAMFVKDPHPPAVRTFLECLPI